MSREISVKDNPPYNNKTTGTKDDYTDVGSSKIIDSTTHSRSSRSNSNNNTTRSSNSSSSLLSTERETRGQHNRNERSLDDASDTDTKKYQPGMLSLSS